MDANVYNIAYKLLYIVILCSYILAKPNEQVFYSPSDHITILNSAIINKTIHGSESAWLVEFYNSWCGHCIRFAPTWKKFGKNVQGWHPVVGIAAIDCSLEDNVPVCRDYNITGFPTLKVFAPNSSRADCGQEFDFSEDVADLRSNLLTYIGSLVAKYPNHNELRKLRPLKSLADIWQHLQPDVHQAAVFFEKPESDIGTQVVLDTIGWRHLVLRRVLAEDVDKFGVTKFPSVYIIHKDELFKEVIPSIEDRHGYVKALHKLAEDGELEEEEEEDDDRNEGQGAGEPPPEDGAQIQPQNLQQALHHRDLVSALHYSFRQEIAGHNIIDGTARKALNDYVTVLRKYWPGPKKQVEFVERIDRWLGVNPQPLSGHEWLTAINNLQDHSGFLPSDIMWTCCEGSKTRYRGYPCALWTTFHVLTVNAALQTRNQDRSTYDPKEVLLAMRGYIQEFFGCRECSENFGKGAVHVEKRVANSNDSVLFLWRSHNKANFHLQGDVTEDPEHPKVQFPPKELCSTCQKGIKEDGSIMWDEEKVLIFLFEKYNKGNIVRDVLMKFDKTSYQMMKGEKDLNESSNKGNVLRFENEDIIRRKDDLQFLAELKAEKKNLKAAYMSTVPSDVDNMKVKKWKKREMDTRITGHAVHTAWGFNMLDVSLCVLFYLICTGIIILFYFHLMVHRKMKLWFCGQKLGV